VLQGGFCAAHFGVFTTAPPEVFSLHDYAGGERVAEVVTALRDQEKGLALYNMFVATGSQ